MDNRRFQNAIHVFIAQHPGDDADNEDMPELVPLDATGSHDTEPQQETTADVEMSSGDSDMPPLTSLSDEDRDNNHDSESDRDAHEVEMQTINQHHLSENTVPNPSPPSHISQDQPAVNNRRARVEDDEDEDRDRRHPSQRIGNSANTASPAGPSSSTPVSPQMPTAAPQPTPGTRFRGQAPIFNRTVVDEATTIRHPFRFFQHMMSNNNNDNDNINDAGNANPVPPSAGPVPAPQPHQDGNTPDNQPHGRHSTIIEGFSVTLDIGLGPAFHMGEAAQAPNGEPTPNAPDHVNPNAQNGLPPNANFADFMTRFGLFGQAMGLGENGAQGTTGATAPAATGNNPDQGAAETPPAAQFGFNIPAGGFNLANLAGLGFGFNLDGSGFGEKEDPERARKLVDGLEEVPVGLVRRLEKVGGTGGGMGEDESKGGDGGCAICWDKLLGGNSCEEDVHQHEESEKKEEENERTQATSSNEAWRPSTAKIVSLPCAHVFHAECLIPWFSRPRQTTCPTCRFNIDPENLTYVSWRRRMRERRDRERAEAAARGDLEDTEGNEAGRDGIGPPAGAAATAAEPVPSVSEHVLNFLSSLESPIVQVRAQTPDATSAFNVHPTPTPRSQSQPPPTSSSTPSSSTPSSSQPTTQTLPTPGGGATNADIHAPAQEGADNWDTMPGLQDLSDSDEEEDEEEEDEDEDESGDEDEGDGAQEQGNGIQAPPVPPQAPTPGGTQAQAQVPRPRQNDPLVPRTIQTAHGLVTLIPIPFPFPSAGNGVGVGVQTGGNANAQAPPAAGQGQLLNVNANANTPQTLPQGGLPFPHFRIQLPHMPEFGAQRGPQGAAPAPPAAPAPANTTANADANSDQAVPTNPFVDAQGAAATTNANEQLIQQLLSDLGAEQVENFRRSTVLGRRADRMRRDDNPDGHLELLDVDEDDVMMDIDEGMGMVVDLNVDQGGLLGLGEIGLNADPASNPAATAAQDEEEFAQVLNFLNHAARHVRGQAQAGTQTQQGRAQRQERGTTGTAADAPSDAPPQPHQQQPPQQQQGQGFAPFMAGLNAGFNIGNHIGNFGPEDGRTMNEFVAQMFTNLMGGPQQQARQQAQQAQGQDAQPQPQPQMQPQPQAGQEPAEGPNHPTNANNNNNGGRPRQAQFAFGNVTIGPFTNIGALFDQIPIFNPNGAANSNVNGGAGSGQERVKKAWTLPPAPGPTLRQRIERRERDAGLRCYDMSCGVGPSDEDPVVTDETKAVGLRQLVIMSKNHALDGKSEGVCMHTFHPGCLVSAERVASVGADVSVIEGGDVEVSCPICRNSGCVTKQEWDEGVLALS